MNLKSYTIKDRRRKWTKIWLIVAVVLIFAILITVFLVRRNYYQHLRPISNSEKTILLTIPSGATAQEIGEKLEVQGLIKARWAFEWYVRSNNVRDKLQAGTYALQPSQSVQEIVEIVTRGKVATDLVRILPGKRLEQIRNDFINTGGFSAEIVDKALDPAQYANHPALADKPAKASLEGYLYPDSYQRTADTKLEDIIRASLNEMQKQLSPTLRANFVKQGLTVHQGVILASIVEKEVNNPTDKPIVAQVFLMRFRIGMQLGSDVTAFYASYLAGEEPSVFIDSPYNTRKYDGLPPGPISNVTKASLQAVANPSSTDYLYFVAGDGPDEGKTYFSNTLEEHEALVKAHCKTLCGQ